MKHYLRQGLPFNDQYRLLFDVRFDYQDVRSGYQGMHWSVFAAPPLADFELDWTPDMVEQVDSGELQEIETPRPVDWLAASEVQMRRFQLRYFRVQIYWNPGLSAYSQPGESRDEFAARCLDRLADRKESDVQQLRDVYLRRILGLRERALSSLEQPGWEFEQRDRRTAEINSAFSLIEDAFGRFLSTPLSQELPRVDFEWQNRLDVESRERVESLWKDFAGSVGEVRDRLIESARDIEIYAVTLTHSDLEVTPRGFLWSAPAGSSI